MEASAGPWRCPEHGTSNLQSQHRPGRWVLWFSLREGKSFTAHSATAGSAPKAVRPEPPFSILSAPAGARQVPVSL